ncbi:hypothetical protein AUC47_13975 [Microbacterium sp. SZ1]|uniref:hypothetical protein n=1 Tax=Microbacterium sp. SZ1 TaxID=1849736 RepID=UPI000BBCAA85|nr:hypothetical protein [Microbacterium sp. SZ1]PCE15402.1 hypothetical protein AUC47_13975 [Microbacterium sp. SZ1]
MSEPDAEPSLVQQRMALQRRRNFAIYTIGSSIVLGAICVTLFFTSGGDVRGWIAAALFAVGLGLGIRDLLRANAATGEFESRHGKDAGKQS